MNKHIRMDAFRRQQEAARERQDRLSKTPHPSRSYLAYDCRPQEPMIDLSPSVRKREWLILGTVDGDPLPRQLCVRSIIESVSDHYDVTVLDLVSHRRDGRIMTPRHVAMYLARNMTTKSLPEIGRLMGGRDHSTICHGIKRIEGLIERDQDFASDLEVLRQKLLKEFS